MTDKVLLARKDQPAPNGYKRITPPSSWKLKGTQFDVRVDDACPICWGSGRANFVKPGARGHNVGEKEQPEGVTEKDCGCVLSAILRHLERLNRGGAKAPGSSQEKSAAPSMSVQARAAIERAQAALDALEEQRAVAVERVNLAVNEALTQTELAQDKLNAVAEMVAGTKEVVVELRNRAEEYGRQAAQLNLEADALNETAAGFNDQLLSLGASLDECKRYQSKKSTEAARVAGRWVDRMKGPKNRLERLLRRANIGEQPTAPEDQPIPFKVTDAGREAIAGGENAYSHHNTPPGYAPCTRTWPHEGPCALPVADDSREIVNEESAS